MHLCYNDFRFSLSEIIYQNRGVKDLHHPAVEMSSSPEGGQDTANTHAHVSELQGKNLQIWLLFKNTYRISTEISAWSLLWFLSDGRNCLMAVLCVSLAQAPDTFCRISDFYYFKLNVSSQQLLLWRWALSHWNAYDLCVDICESCTAWNNSCDWYNFRTRRRVSFQKCGKETWCHCWQRDSKNNK